MPHLDSKNRMSASQRLPNRKRLLRLLAPCACLILYVLSTDLQISAAIAVQEQTDRIKFQSTDLSVPFKPCWSYLTKSASNITFASDNALDKNLKNTGNLLENKSGSYFLLDGNRLVLLDITAGRQIWTSDLGGRAVSNLAIGGESVFVVLRRGDDYYLKNVGKSGGITIWQKKIAVAAANNAEHIEDDENGGGTFFLRFFENKLILINQSGEFYAFAAETGDLLWNAKTGRRLTTIPSLAENKIFAGTSDDKLSITASGGEMETAFEAKMQITAIASKSSGRVYIGGKDGSVLAVDPENKTTFWKSRIGGAQISDLTLTANGLLVSSFDNFIYFISANNGRRIWKRRLSGRIFHKPMVVGGYAVAAGLFDASAAIIDLKNGKIVNRINSEQNAFFSGEFFFADDKIIAVTSSGLTAFTTFDAACLKIS